MEKKRNLWVIPTDKPSRLYRNISEELSFTSIEFTQQKNGFNINQNIYITSEKEMRDCWVLNTHTNDIYFLEGYYGIQPIIKKIILTTDQDLIKDGVQAIDDEFLEWFVKNPSCEEVEVKPMLSNNGRALYGYKIIIPKEEPRILTVEAFNKAKISYKEPKQETLEEAANRILSKEGVKLHPSGLETYLKGNVINAMVEMAKWQQERSYSAEDLKKAFDAGYKNEFGNYFRYWFEQFKNK
jgi:hypothetical protein